MALQCPKAVVSPSGLFCRASTEHFLSGVDVGPGVATVSTSKEQQLPSSEAACASGKEALLMGLPEGCARTCCPSPHHKARA